MADETPQAGSDAWGPWRARIAASQRRRKDLVSLWQQNVDARRGRMAETAGRDTDTSVNQDWPLTKAKIAQLYSQTPEVRLTPRHDAFKAAVPVFGRILNDTIADSCVGPAIEEVLADVVNASGIGGVLVSCEKRTEPREVPLVDPATLPPEMQQAIATGAAQLPMEIVDHVVDARYPVQRISPADLLVPSDFTGSQYDQARWLGHDGRMTWPQAQLAFGLTDDVKEQVLGTDNRAGGVSNSLNTDTTKFRDTEVVNFTEIFYWRHYYHHDETSFRAIQRIVFVEGIEEPVINEPYAGQQRIESGAIVGVTKLPIRVLTLTYISDDSLPPSDSTIGRFQVDELEASRDAMVQQRKHSIPIRWFDSNRVSPNTRSLLEKGTFQGFIPTNGPGDRAVGEVARASFPQEKFEFDRIIKSDLTEIWQVGTNQAGAFASGERSAREAGIIQQNFQTRVGQERDKVTRFFTGIAEVQAGLLALFGNLDLELPPDVPPESIANGFVYSSGKTRRRSSSTRSRRRRSRSRCPSARRKTSCRRCSLPPSCGRGRRRRRKTSPPPRSCSRPPCCRRSRCRRSPKAGRRPPSKRPALPIPAGKRRPASSAGPKTEARNDLRTLLPADHRRRARSGPVPVPAARHRPVRRGRRHPRRPLGGARPL
jgi:hypothetical protein